MIMTSRLRKFVLTAHVASAVGWLGAAAAYLVLAIDVDLLANAQTVRAVVPVMTLVVWSVVVPLSLASLVTGAALSLGTTWGLARHYWILFKIAMNLLAVFLVQEYAQSISGLAGMAAHGNLAKLRDPGHIVHSGGGLVVLLMATVLAVYKPRGMTRYGLRHPRQQRVQQHRQRPARVL